LAETIRARETASENNKYMNVDLVNKALEKVLNPYVLVNLLSRRVRQLNAGAGKISRPLINNTANLGVMDIALREIIEDKIGFELPEFVPPTGLAGQNRRRPQGWMKPPAATNKAAA
jgi:DNA-directed RNA polymerase subunit omega